MNKVTITEANRRFSHLIKQVDSEGCVAITKGGDTKYMIMTRKEFEKMNKKLIYGKVGDQMICVEQRPCQPTIWKFDKDFGSYTAYTADKLNISEDLISMEADKFFKVSFWEDITDEPSAKAKELFESFPEDLKEYRLSVKSRDRTWE